MVAVADASTFQKNIVFAISGDGQLLQYDVKLQEWADFGQPTWSSIGPTEGIAISNEQTGERSLFLLSTKGTLVELLNRGSRVLGSTESWEWFDHGSPDGDRVVGPPGGLINMRSIFMVSENGTVYERYWDEKTWIWVSHGHSGVPMLPARPVALDNRHIFFLREDSLLTERFWNGIEWVWSIHPVPAHSDAKEHIASDGSTTVMVGSDAVSFCSPEIGVRDSCAPPLYGGNS